MLDVLFEGWRRPLWRPRDRWIAIFDQNNISNFLSAVNFFKIFGHQTPRFGLVFYLKGWIRIRITSSLCRELRVLRGPEPALGLQPGVLPLRARHLPRLEWGRYRLPHVVYFYTEIPYSTSTYLYLYLPLPLPTVAFWSFLQSCGFAFIIWSLSSQAFSTKFWFWFRDYKCRIRQKQIRGVKWNLYEILQLVFPMRKRYQKM